LNASISISFITAILVSSSPLHGLGLVAGGRPSDAEVEGSNDDMELVTGPSKISGGRIFKDTVVTYLPFRKRTSTVRP
jgi:hypothetical protein